MYRNERTTGVPSLLHPRAFFFTQFSALFFPVWQKLLVREHISLLRFTDGMLMEVILQTELNSKTSFLWRQQNGRSSFKGYFCFGEISSGITVLKQQAISEFPRASVSKRGSVLSFGYGNDFSFSCK